MEKRQLPCCEGSDIFLALFSAPLIWRDLRESVDHPLCWTDHPLELGLVLGRCTREPGGDGMCEDGLMIVWNWVMMGLSSLSVVNSQRKYIRWWSLFKRAVMSLEIITPKERPDPTKVTGVSPAWWVGVAHMEGGPPKLQYSHLV